jgi:hypothetical protein
MSAGGGTNASGPCRGACNPEKVFEFAEGSLGCDQEREVRGHLASCAGCRELYERELHLSAYLNSLDFSRVCASRSVSQGVAMALPTRSTKVRAIWAGLAVVLLLATSVAMMLYGANLAVLLIDAMNVFWGFVAGFADVIQVVFSAVGQALLVALAIGAFVDLVIAAVYLGVSRRRAREV